MPLPISLFISTKNRSTPLRQVLTRVDQSRIQDLDLEIICVDNGSTDDTPQVLAELGQKMPIKVLQHPFTGLASARNVALDFISQTHSENRLLIATDDDIIPDTHWIRNLHHAAKCHGPNYFFGGRITPKFLQINSLVKYLTSYWPNISRPLYAIYDWPADTSSPPILPFGPNMACFLDQVRSQRYDSNFGMPTCVGEETDLGHKLLQGGYLPKYVHDASVRHVVRKEQLEIPWMHQRMRLQGISEARIIAKHSPDKLYKFDRRLKRKIRNYHLRRFLKPQAEFEFTARQILLNQHHAAQKELRRLLEQQQAP